MTQRISEAERRLMAEARADADAGMHVAAYLVLSALVTGGVMFVVVLRLSNVLVAAVLRLLAQGG